MSRSAAWQRMRTYLRKAAARTVDALWDTIADALSDFSPNECANYLAHAGYVPLNRNPL